jgi:predicted amidohydrolase
MKISVAQIRPIKGDISANISNHKNFLDLAVLHNADAIFFPELSLTSYEPTLAKELAVNLNNLEFDQFQKISNRNKITIGFGLPTKTESGIQISMIIIQPKAEMEIYSKQQLHFDEFPFFVKGENQIILTVGDKKIAPAICYESLQPSHSELANKYGAEIYIASVAKSQKGIAKAKKHFPVIAKRYSMPVLMSNSVGYCDSFLSSGQSSVWTKGGVLAGMLSSKGEGILIYDSETEEVKKIIYR